MIDATITIGNVIQTIGMIAVALIFYFKRDAGVATLLENHDVRIKANEGHLGNHDNDIRDIYKTKEDKK